MQTHESRNVVSEFLKDRYPYLEQPFPDDVISTEIAVSYGRRGIPKLIEVLNLPDSELPPEDRALALRVFNSLLSNQEAKQDAIACESGVQLVRHSASSSIEVSALSCRGMELLSLIMIGRYHVVSVGGVEALTADLDRCPTEAAEALKAVAAGPEGRKQILESPKKVVFALTALINDRGKPEASVVAAMDALSRVAESDEGVLECLRAHLPAALLNRLKQVTEAPYMGGLGSKVRTAASEALSQLCHHPYGKVQVLEQGPGERQITGVEALCRLLTAPEWLVRKFATRALMGLTVEVPAKLPVARLATIPLVALLKGADLELAENARQVLLNCKEFPDAASTIFSVMSREEWHDTFGKGFGPFDQHGYFVV